MERETDLLVWSFVGLLTGGILILVGGVAGVGMMGFGGYGMGMGHMTWTGTPAPVSWGWWMGIWGFLTGATAIVAAVNVRARRNVATWGTVGIVTGALSLLAMGGFFVGALATITGGALALAASGTRPAPPRTPGA